MGKLQKSWVQMGLMSFLQWIVIPPIVILKEKLRSWLPVDMNAVIAQSAGTAMGILKRDRGRVYEMLEKIGFKVERIPMNILTGLDHPRLSGLSFSS